MRPIPFVLRILLFLVPASSFLAACGGTKATPAPTAIYDPCDPANVVAEVKKVNDLQRAFDDASQLASVTPFNQLTTVIPSMQEIRRQAQDQQIPPCLAKLKTLQLQQIDATINTFLAFLAGGSQNPNTELLSQGIAQARLLHEQYNQELARLLGATYIPPAPSPTRAVPGISATATDTPISASITNPGPYQVKLRAQPDLDANYLALLDIGQSLPANGRTADGLWIQVKDMQGTVAWVYASLVQVTGMESLPIVTP